MEKQAQNKYRELSNEEKNWKRGYVKNWYRNMSEEIKKELKSWCETNKFMETSSFLLSMA